MTSTALPRRLLINSTAIFGGEAIARLSTALMALVVARFYGMDALGNYGYALALASVLRSFRLGLTCYCGNFRPQSSFRKFLNVH
jgi:hypothetical protein